MNKQKIFLFFLSLWTISYVMNVRSMLLSDSEEDPYEKSQKYRENGEHQDALRNLKEAANSGNREASIFLAKHYVETNKLAKAKLYLKKPCDYDESRAWFLRGWIAENENKINYAKRCYDEAVRLGYMLAENQLGKIYRQEGNYLRALYHYKRVANANNSSALYWVGKIYERIDTSQSSTANLKDPQRAERYFAKAAEAGHKLALRRLGILYDAQDNKSKAKKYFKLAADKGDTYSLYRLWCIYTAAGKKNKATTCYHRIEENSPIPPRLRYNFDVRLDK